MVIAAANPCGALAATWFADKCERKWQLAFSALSIAVFGLIFSQQTSPLGIIVVGVIIAFSNTVLAYSLHAYQSELYPTRVRARAVGFTYGFISRLSTIFIPFMIAFCLRNYGTIGVFAFIASAMVAGVPDHRDHGPEEQRASASRRSRARPGISRTRPRRI